MGEVTVLHGCIYGAQGSSAGTAHWTGLFRRNLAAIAELPLPGEGLPLTASMFTVPMDWGSRTFWRHQPIHFAGSFNNVDFDGDWPEWVDRFEALLRRMFWLKAHLHVDSELLGERHYVWRMTSGDPYADPPTPVTAWDSSGNARDFYAPT
jgi:hypothetical protein